VARQARQQRNDGSDSAARTDAFSPINGSRASELVLEQIRDAFFTGMKPGDWLGTETELARRFGVSRLTMRDAVRTLEAYGMVDVKVGAGGGLRIAQADSKHFVEALAVQIHLLGVGPSELTEALEVIEPRATRLAAERRTDEQLERLRKCLELHTDPAENPVGFHDAAAQFHAIIAEASGNQPLYVALRAVRINEVHLLDPDALSTVNEPVFRIHERIFRAIERKSAAEAERLMASHISRLSKSLASDGRITKRRPSA
jgi:GntR family transcriptional regulator, transcriptional repressor for pyruvate dehydrogenase complex